MKKNILFFVISFIILNAYGQEKKEQPNNRYKFNFGIGGGIERFVLNTDDPNTSENITIFDKTKDVLKIHVDYTFVKRFSLGLNFEGCGFFVNNRSSSNNENYIYFVTSGKAGVSLKYKFISKEKNHLFVEIIPVFSRLSYKSYSTFVTFKYYVNGKGGQAAIGWDHFFTKHFGINIRSIYSLINYKDNPNYKTLSNPYNIPTESIETYYSVHTAYGSTLGLLIRF
jgi:hypothetical protein